MHSTRPRPRPREAIKPSDRSADHPEANGFRVISTNKTQDNLSPARSTDSASTPLPPTMSQSRARSPIALPEYELIESRNMTTKRQKLLWIATTLVVCLLSAQCKRVKTTKPQQVEIAPSAKEQPTPGKNPAGERDNHKIGDVLSMVLSDKEKITFQWCPPGSFDIQAGQLTITKGYWLATTEVTQAQWSSVMGNNPCLTPSSWAGPHDRAAFVGVNLPVHNIRWPDAQDFIAKINAKGELPNGWKMTLPTEAQWEYACRAGVRKPAKYYEGIQNDVAWYGANSGGQMHPVGTKKPNEWGLYDMLGNVWEWCDSWYDVDYKKSNLIDPMGPSSGPGRINRGGAWSDEARCINPQFRSYGSMGRSDNLIGFRPAIVKID